MTQEYKATMPDKTIRQADIIKNHWHITDPLRSSRKAGLNEQRNYCGGYAGKMQPM